MDKKTTDWSLIAQNIENEDQESNLSEDEEFKNSLKDCKQLWNVAQFIGKQKKKKEELSDAKLNACLAKMRQRIENTERTSIELKPRTKSPFPYPLIGKIAASIILVLALGYGVSKFIELPTASNTIEITSYATQPSEKKIIALPDGTKVWLNANSTLQYTSNYSKNRAVTLKGEGYFEVISNKKNPFIVKSGDTYTKVLGTRFNLKAYDSEAIVRMTVVEGEVEFGANNQSNPLTVGVNQQAVFNKTRSSINKADLASPANIAWKENKLAFNSVTLQEVIGILNRHYQTNIAINDTSLDSLDFSTTSTMDFNDKTLKETLEIISLTLGVEYQETEEGFVISR